MTVSPTQRSLAHLRNDGWVAEIVEHWNSYARIRQDLFGCIDIIALRGRETLAVQTTTGTNLAARVTKVADNPHIGAMREAGWTIHCHGWRKIGKPPRWELRTIDVS